ncbi:MAG: DUF302 domain-containing protein [Campylobacteraceae bacterium]|nr:DUF302 domain-containing protein [Campylobacteraceae bacterium]
MKIILKSLIFLLLTQTLLQANENPVEIRASIVYSTNEESWEDVNESVKEAIINKGIVISYTSHVMKLLERTAKMLGKKQDAYKNAQIHLFCQVSLSSKMYQSNPHIITGCPYGIAVYELQSKPGTIYVSYRKAPSEEPAFADVVKLQDSIVRDALDL